MIHRRNTVALGRSGHARALTTRRGAPLRRTRRRPTGAAQTARPSGAATPRPNAAPVTRLVINADLARDTISRHIYGQFAEHLGRVDLRWRVDQGGGRVAPARRRHRGTASDPGAQPRWPGGCFADYYHWRDGIGPRAQRPTMVNNNWGGVTEDNGVGTDEYLELVARLGAEPFIVGNVGSGSVQEMQEWWEYLNHPGKSPMADLRRKNGHDAPYNVKFWGVGNESWGCGGNMRPEYYADRIPALRQFLRAFSDSRAPFASPRDRTTTTTSGWTS